MPILLPLLFIVFVFILAVSYLLKIIGLAYPLLFWGAIYVPTSEKRVEQMIGLLDLNSAHKAADLGAGDGRLVIAFAKLGIESHGYEINPFLVLLGRKNIKKAGLENKAFMHFKNLWQEDLKGFDVITLYGMRHMMARLEKKLDKELKPGSMIVSNYFTFPKWKPSSQEDNLYLYIKK
jgi:cyclopropane fatty-acyl-phospholipid synthase-like methyltransferase